MIRNKSEKAEAIAAAIKDLDPKFLEGIMTNVMEGELLNQAEQLALLTALRRFIELRSRDISRGRYLETIANNMAPQVRQLQARMDEILHTSERIISKEVK